MEQKFEMLQKQMQRMILSPQMQQAVYMLQIPLQKLQQLVRQELNTNPVLEELADQELEPIESQPEETQDHEEELDFKEEFDVLNKLDEEWRDYFSQTGSYRKFTQQDEEKRRFMMDSITRGESLHDHLLKQLGMLPLTPEKKKIGELIVGNIDENGYLDTSVEELSITNNIPKEQVEETIDLIQTFNPIGVGARSLSECLLIQIDRLGNNNTLVKSIIEKHLDLVGGHKYSQIAELLNTDEKSVKNAIDFITTLEPKPGSTFSTETAQYITPDVFVEKIDGEYLITLNDERIPHLHISNLYKNLISKKGTSAETIKYIKSKIQAGSWLVKNIHQRQQTIQKISSEIVKIQTEFLDEGIIFLKPLTMQEVANSVNLHESTVSRAIANKYMQTPQGTFQMKYFFTSGVKTASGESISVSNLKEQLAQLIKEEDPKHPLSDQDIINKLSSEGIKIARRTIAKYRQELNISASNLRKKT